MPWTPDGIYVDEYGNPAYPGDEAFGGGGLAGDTVTPPYIPPEQLPAASPLVAADPLPVPAVETPPPPPFVPTVIPGGAGSSQSQGTSFSASYAGTPAADRSAFAAGYEGDKAYRESTIEPQVAAAMAPLDAAYGARMGSLATPAEVAGAPTRYKAETDQINATADQARRLANMYRDFASQEKAAHDAGQAHIAAASQAYQSQVQQYQAMSVDPNALWGNMSGHQRAGTFASVFIHDFLGARGVHTSVMDTINRAIDRNIDAQKANIAQAGQSAAMFKDLYTMAVNESASEDEARSRMRGFYLAQMEKDVASEMAKYDAPLAQSKMAEAIAMLRLDRAKVAEDVRNHITARVDGLLGQDADMRKASLSAATQRMSIAASERMSNAEIASREKLAGGGAATVPEVKNLIKDPFTGKPVGKAVNDEAWKRATELSAHSANMVNKLDVYLDAKAKSGAVFKGPGARQLQGEADSKAAAAHADLLSAYVLAMTGKAMTVSEAQRLGYVVPEDTWLTVGDRNQVLNQFGKGVMDGWKVTNNQYVNKLNNQEQAWADSGAYDSPSLSSMESRSTVYGTGANPVPPVNTYADEKLAGAANERWTSASRLQAAEEAAQSVSGRSPEVIASTILQLDRIAYDMVDESGTGLEDRNAVQAIRDRLAQEYLDVTGTPAPPPRVPLPGEEFAPVTEDAPVRWPGQ